MNLQLSLTTEWFLMTKSGEKTEDYREITPYWFKRMFNCFEIEEDEIKDLVELAQTGRNVSWFNEWELLSLKPFNTNTMTFGYPKKGDTERTLIFEHDGIEIRTGKPEWGAEPDKLYFVIKHGKRIKQ